MGEILFPAFDPVLLDLPGPLDIRWYGLMYVVAFFAGQLILARLCRRGFLPMTEAQVGDLIFWLVLGVLLGGRTGYALFYEQHLLHPLEFVQVWKGGLSFHGGLLGVMLTIVLFSRRFRVGGWRLSDALALAVTPGIFAVRIANFVNGELFGRVTDASVPWAMRFPTDETAMRLLRTTHLDIRSRELKTLEALRDGSWQQIKEQVPLRHPSQIYEALGEGLLVGACLWFLYRATRHSPLGRGVYGGLFLGAYGVVRFGLEFFRQPDKQFVTAENPLGTVLGPLSMGQVLCVAMVAIGVAIAWLRRGKA